MELAEVIRKPRIDGIKCRRHNDESFEGSVVITGHHLIIQSCGANSSVPHTSLLILHKNIDLVTVERVPVGPGGVITLKCKDFSIVALDCSSPTSDGSFTSFEECQEAAKSIEILSNLADVKLHYPYFYQCSFRIYENGWEVFNMNEDEFFRLQALSDLWRISHVNRNFAVCSSYPEKVIVPKTVSDDYLRSSAMFRDSGRFPVLSYYHKETKAVIVRCSQPLVGNNNRRCKEDELLLNAMLNTSNKGYIIDTRSPNVAQLAKSRGFGYEPEIYYPRWKRIHRACPRWPSLQDSIAKLIEACNDGSLSTDKWLSKSNASGWLQNVADVLNCACLAAQCLDREEMSVVVHGSEGTDSTLMVVSLVQVILDPDCRTIKGFESLIEREWVKAGHPFASRCAHLAYGKSKSSNVLDAPSFLLFLDCVWQIYNQFPCSFEFVQSLLVFICDNAFASEFGTFLLNNEKEKYENKTKEKTISLWSYINRPEILNTYINPFYEPNKNPLWPSVAPQSIELWQRMYCRYTRNWTNADEEWSYLVQLKQEEKELNSKVAKLQRQLASLEAKNRE